MFAALVRNGLSRRYALPCSENSKASKVANARSLICRKAARGEGLTAADMEKCCGSNRNSWQQSNMRNGRRPTIFFIPDLSRCGTTKIRVR
jgi:hypothetical protein